MKLKTETWRCWVFPDESTQTGRLVYSGRVGETGVAVFLDYLQPLKPPSVYVLSKNPPVPEELLNPDGSVELFCGNRYWDPNEMTASVVVDWLEEILSVPVVEVAAQV